MVGNSMRRKPEEKNYVVSVRIPESVKHDLETICDKESRSLSNLILVACREYLTNHADKLT